MSHRGDPVVFEFFSLDATTPGLVTIRNDGALAARTLAADERLVVTGVSCACDVNAGITVVTLFSDNNGNGAVDLGERIAVFPGTGGGQVSPMSVSAKLGVTPKIMASATGVVIIVGWGYVMKG